MILETRGSAQANSTSAPLIEFVTMQLMPLADGLISVSMKQTIFDEQELELIDQEIVDGRVASLDQLFALVRSHVRIAEAPAATIGNGVNA
jgi:hypothetical protein